MQTASTTLNVSYDSDDRRASELSNFAHYGFILDGSMCASTEGFIQAIMWPERSENFRAGLNSWAREAKKLGKTAERKFVYWKGRTIPFGSSAHHGLIERAIRAKFEQNPSVMRLLRETKGLTLIHDTGRPESPVTALPAALFCTFLTLIREGKPPHYPYGTDAEPIRIKTQLEPMGCGFQALAFIGETLIVSSRGETRSNAIFSLIQNLQSAQPKLVLEFDQSAFG